MQANPDEAFDAWAAEHQKVYTSEEERSRRLAVWLDNLAYIETHNENTDSHWVFCQLATIMAWAIPTPLLYHCPARLTLGAHEDCVDTVTSRHLPEVPLQKHALVVGLRNAAIVFSRGQGRCA